MRYFEISVQRICGEFTCGRVSRDFYDYWLGREGDTRLETHMLNLDDDDHRDPDSPAVDGSTDDVSGWYDVDDIIHINNAVVDGNTIHVEEVMPDEDVWTGYKYVPDGYSEEFHFGQLSDRVPPSFYNYSRQVVVDMDREKPENPVIVCKSIEKGLQTQVYVETEGEFDIRKLQFEIWEVDGDSVIASISYEGVVLENHPDSSDGRAFYAYLGDLVTNEGAPRGPSEEDMAALDEELANIQAEFASKQTQNRRPFIWSMLITTTVLLGVAAIAFFAGR